MHQSSYDLMKNFTEKYLNKSSTLKIIDIGSVNIGGCYRPLFLNDTWTYSGLDLASGPNVDIVSEQPYNWPLQDEIYDVVISGQCLEHVEMPWLWIKEVSRICKKSGYVVIIAPWSWPIHRYPVDCWRILPDGLLILMTKLIDFKIVYCGTPNEHDTMCIAIKN
jgi:hypothetical protein